MIISKKRFFSSNNTLFYAITSLLILLFSLPVMAQKMIIESLSGPVTQNEINAFKAHIQNVDAPSGNGNVWVFGNGGKSIEACGLMYEVSHDRTILNRMICYCDEMLSRRNDLWPAEKGGQHIIWTGKIEPVWPSSNPDVTPAGAGIEQGDEIAHMSYCARLILSDSSLWNEKVDIGDSYQFGATYKELALKYINEGDYVIDNWIISHFIRTNQSNHYYFPGSPNTYKANEPAPWNQAWMLTNALVRLVECHLILNDDMQRISRYDAIIQPNIDWFRANVRPTKSAKGTLCYTWAYALPKGIEDTNHAAYDSEGLWIAYDSGRYKLNFDDLLPFANTYCDIVMGTVTNGKFAGRVDGTTGTGHGGGDNYVRDEYIYLAEFRPDMFMEMANTEINADKIASSIPITARLLWEKDRRYKSQKQ
ncbi:alpha-1,2-mannosidase [Mucilaginibacter sp. L196]|uniref:alpha-1,2-mannosidase n=1 Tax=Mucilaginibacter sp. L196 TaxID=1641870 RepID=UPI0020B10BCD|nr:alpha-1,2-mannosidase [Mucilaginibacter sp. L196]